MVKTAEMIDSQYLWQPTCPQGSIIDRPRFTRKMSRLIIFEIAPVKLENLKRLENCDF